MTPILNPRYPDAMYQYELTIMTGRGKESGTTAQVFIQIFGAKENSGPIVLKDDDREIFLGENNLHTDL